MERLRTHLLVLLTLTVAVCAPALGQEQDTAVKIGVLAKRGTERCLEKWGPTAEYLTSQVPGHSFTLVPLDYEEVDPAVERGDVDFILTNSSFYVGLEKLYGVNRIATLKNQRTAGAYIVFGGVIFRRADREDIQDLEDLKSKTFMAVEETSFGGWHAAWRELKERGIDPHHDFSGLTFAGTHDAVVYAVRDGKVDAGTVRTDTLERMAAEGKIRLEDFRALRHDRIGEDVCEFPFLHSTGMYPEWPLAELAHTSHDLAEKAAIALIGMPADSPAAQAARCAGWTVPQNYQPVHDCLKELRIGPYKDYGKVTPWQVFQQYWPFIAGAAALVVVGLLVTLHVTRLNARLRESVAAKEREITERKRAEEGRERALRNMDERVRELRCLHGVAESIRKRSAVEDLFQDVAALLPPTWCYPEIARGLIHFDGKDYVSEPFERTRWSQTADIIVGGERRGFVEVCYLEQRPDLDEGPFVKEERNLINSIAHALSEAAERKQAEDVLTARTAELEQRTIELEKSRRVAMGIMEDAEQARETATRETTKRKFLLYWAPYQL